MSYALKLAAAGILFLAAGIALIVIFNALWFRIGLGTALAVVVGALLYYAWRVDRKAKEARAGLENV
jgi:hypothetical protein